MGGARAWPSGRQLVLGATLAVLTVYLGACCAFYIQSGVLTDTSTRTLRAADGGDNEAALKAQTRAELGRGTWNMLHRLAAQFEKEPTPQQRRDVEQFFSLLGTFYPCPECAGHFREMLVDHPVDSRSNRDLSLWLCKLHNIVNARLAKPQFPCELDALKDRWGACGCFDDATNGTAVSIGSSLAAKGAGG
jgi:FAD-linked sulfhydryl oxidase